jgi:ABC-type multidrug transport system fused ATPase/permease subunit
VEAFKSFCGTVVNAVYFDLLPIIFVPLLITNIQTGNTEEVYRISMWFCLLIIGAFVVRILMRGWYWYSHRKFWAILEQKYRPIILLKDNLYFEKTGTGKVQSIVENGLQSWSRTVNDSIWYTTRILFTFILGFYVIPKADPALVWMFLIFIFLSVGIHLYFRRYKYKLDLKQKDVRNDFNAASVRSVMSRNEIMFSDKVGVETKNLFELKLKEHKLGVQTDIYGAISVVPSELFFLILPFTGVSFYLYFLNPTLSASEIGALVAFVYFASKMSTMVWQFIGFVWVLLDGFPDVRKLWDFLDSVPPLQNYREGKVFERRGGNIVFENVSFGYEDTNFLKNFSATFLENSKTAIVGKSGSGKTTIAKLAIGYLKPKAGKVLIDGQDVGQMNLSSLYKYVGYLSQEPFVFDGTIMQNLVYATTRKVSQEEVEQALRQAHCDFVFELKKGLHTEIGERGVRLSGGERQRLAIAKLFLKNPEIIILDEPTSALDSFSEEKITQSLEQLFKDRTTIIIAHRLQTVKRADRILVIENGEIVEDGNHENLVAKGGVYSQMLSMQSGF